MNPQKGGVEKAIFNTLPSYALGEVLVNVVDITGVASSAQIIRASTLILRWKAQLGLFRSNFHTHPQENY